MSSEDKIRYSAVVDHTGKAYIGVNLEESNNFNDFEGNSTDPNIKEGFWTNTKNEKTTQARLGDVVRFHIKTENIDKGTLKLTLRDWDDWINTDDYPKGAPKSITINSNKGFVEFTIPKKWEDDIDDDYGDEIELYFDVEYKGESHELPKSSDDYLKVSKRLGEVFLDTKTKTIKIYNEILFYGSKATKTLATQMANDIESMWNDAKGKVIIKGENYSVEFSIKGKIINSNIKNVINKNNDKWKKFIRVEDKTEASVSYVDNLKSNTGFFQLKNVQKPNSTTEAHEFGHTWGLDHPSAHDYRGKGTPHIMLPRGTFVDKKFQYDPNANVNLGEKGSTINPKYRKVLQKNIDDLKIENLIFNNNWSNLSNLTNIYHEKVT